MLSINNMGFKSQNIQNSFGNKNSKGCQGAVYAEKGEPIYQKDKTEDEEISVYDKKALNSYIKADKKEFEPVYKEEI